MTTASFSLSSPAGMRKTLTGLVWLLVLCLAVVTAFAAFGERFWLVDLIIFFRPQLALAALLVLLAAIGFRRWGATAVAAALLLVNAAPLVFAGVPMAAPAKASDLRIVSANLLFDNATRERFGEIVAGLSPDIIVTQEARQGWPQALEALPGYPYRAGREELTWNSNLVLSRYPLRARLVAGMPPSGNELGGAAAVRVEVDLPGQARPPVIYAIHAPTPRTFAGWQARNRYLDTVAERIAAEPEGTPVVLAGDWNTPVWSPAYARMFLLSGLEATEDSAWPAATRLFPVGVGGVQIGTPIDHIAVSREIGVARLFTGGDFGSDHLPVVADLKLP